MTKKRRIPVWACIFPLNVLAFFAPATVGAQASAKPPVCRADQLLAYYQGWGLSMAHDYAKVIVRNRSASTCELRGFPQIRQFDEHGNELQGGIAGGCLEDVAREPCPHLVLKPHQRASFVIGMLDGTGLENPTCATKLILDSPLTGSNTWPNLVLLGFISCGAVGPEALEYQSAPGVEIDPYMNMQASFPRGVPSGNWLLNLVDANRALGQRAGPYNLSYDPPFELILQNPDDNMLSQAIETWCDGVVIELRGPDGKLVPRATPPCKLPQSRAPLINGPAGSLALTLYLYDLGYDLSRPGNYKLTVQWRLATASEAVPLKSNETVFTVAK